MMTTDKMLTETEISAATTGALIREVRWLETWIRMLKPEYAVEYRIARDRILDEIDQRNRRAFAN